MAQERCSGCRQARASVSFDGRVLCEGCLDRQLSAATGWPRLPPPPRPKIVVGPDGQRHLIQYRLLRMPGGITAVAEERVAPGRAGYRLEVTADHRDDPAPLLEKIRHAIRSAVGHPCLELDERNEWTLVGDEVAGRLTEDENPYSLPHVVIDGRLLTWDEFGELLSSFTGWSFHLRLGGEPAISDSEAVTPTFHAGESEIETAEELAWYVLDSAHYPTPVEWDRARGT